LDDCLSFLGIQEIDEYIPKASREQSGAELVLRYFSIGFASLREPIPCLNAFHPKPPRNENREAQSQFKITIRN